MKKLIPIYTILVILFGFYIYQVKDGLFHNNTDNRERLQGSLNDEFVMVTFQGGIDYWKKALKGFEDAAGKLNVSVVYRGSANYDLHEQITILEQVISKKPAGIALSAINPTALNDTINKAMEAGIPVVLFDSDAPESKAGSFLGTNNYVAGVKGADKLASDLSEEGKVAVITLPNQQNHKERTEGFMNTIKGKYPNMEVVQVLNGEGNQLVSQQVAEEILTRYPDIKGIFATEANGGVGVADAANKLLKEDLKILSFDVDKQTLDYIKNGDISATLAQGTWEMGYWAMHFLFEQKESSLSIEDASLLLPEYVNTGLSIVTNQNVDTYYADYK